MKPTCKVCQKAHWTYEGHSVSEVKVPEYVQEMARGALGVTNTDIPTKSVDTVARRPAATGVTRSEASGAGANVATTQSYEPPVTVTVPTKVSLHGNVPTCSCGKPREGRYKSCAACRKRAYRERSK